MHSYETLFILHPDVPEAQVRETIERTRKLIEGMEGHVLEIHDWGLRELAYPIEKQGRGNYILAQYEASSAVVNELERTMKLSDEVLRFVSVRMPRTTAAGPSSASPVDSDGDDAGPDEDVSGRDEDSESRAEQEGN